VRGETAAGVKGSYREDCYVVGFYLWRYGFLRGGVCKGKTPLSCMILWAGILRGVLGSYGEDSYGRDRIRLPTGVLRIPMRGSESYGRAEEPYV